MLQIREQRTVAELDESPLETGLGAGRRCRAAVKLQLQVN